MITLSPGLRLKMYDEAMPAGTSWKPTCGLGLKGGVAMRTVSMMRSPSAG